MVFVDGLTRAIKTVANIIKQHDWFLLLSCHLAQPLGGYRHLLYWTVRCASMERWIRNIVADMKADGGEEEPLTAFWSRHCGFELSVYHLHERIEFFQLKPSESKWKTI